MSREADMDAMLDALIDIAVKNSVEKMGAELPEPKNIEFSKEHEARMHKLFRRERNKLRMKKAYKYTKRIAVILLAIIVASGITIFSVEALRVRFLNFVIEMTSVDADINFNENHPNGDSYSSDEITLGYIPDGFAFESSETDGDRIRLEFKQGEKFFGIYLRPIDSSFSIDVEGSDARKTSVNGNTAFFSTSENTSILVWHDGVYSYLLSGNIDDDTLLEIAKNIKK